ncbi:MAG: HAD-IA family hydrolase, partial [Candidatus Omnitrophica bacterium]|nr:HAD-IA family hydrolase [Candidatus Omnitrophota bacterium]
FGNTLSSGYIDGRGNLEEAVAEFTKVIINMGSDAIEHTVTGIWGWAGAYISWWGIENAARHYGLYERYGFSQRDKVPNILRDWLVNGNLQQHGDAQRVFRLVGKNITRLVKALSDFYDIDRVALTGGILYDGPGEVIVDAAGQAESGVDVVMASTKKQDLQHGYLRGLAYKALEIMRSQDESLDNGGPTRYDRHLFILSRLKALTREDEGSIDNGGNSSVTKSVIIFDLDHTLYATPDLDRAYSEYPIEFIHQRTGVPSDEIRRIRAELGTGTKTLKHYGISPADYLIAFYQRYRPHVYIEENEKLKDVLKRLSARFRFALVTNNGPQFAREALEVLGIDDLFSLVVSQLDVVNKPNSDMFLQVCKKLRVKPAEVISVGDRKEVDIDPAVSIGMKGILVKGPMDIINFLETKLKNDSYDNGNGSGVTLYRNPSLEQIQPRAPPALRIIPAIKDIDNLDTILALAGYMQEGVKKAFPFEFDINIGKPVSLDKFLNYAGGYYHPQTNQYVLPYSIDNHKQQIPTLVITDADLTGETEEGSIKDCLFGRAYPSKNITITSAYRFQSSRQKTLISRNIKNAIHEIGHLFGMGTHEMPLSDGAHCADPTCAIHFTPSTRELDVVELRFCPDCLAILKKAFPQTHEAESFDNGSNASQTSLRIKAAESLGRLPLDKNETIAIPALKAMLAIETDPAVQVTIERILAMVRNQRVFLDDKNKPLDNGSSIQSKTQPLIIFGQTVSASRINGQKPLDNGSWLESADIPSISLLKPTEIRAWYDQRGIFNIWVKNNPEFSYRIPGLLSFNEVPCGSFTDSLQKTIAKYGFYIQLIPASYVDVFFGTYLSVPGLSGRFKAGSFKLGVKGKEGNEQVIKLRYGPFYNVVDAFNLAFKNLLQDSSNSPKPFDNGGDKSKAIRLETANLFAETISEEDRFAEDDIKSLSLPLRRIKESFTDEIFSASTGAGRNLLRKNWREWVLPWIDPFMPENEVIDNVFDVDALLANNNTLNRLVSLAERVREIGTEAWVHIGIGGSVIPTKALVNPALSVYHNDLTRKARGQAPKVYYTGDNFSGKKVHDLIEALTTQEILFKTIYNVISKSGTTQETIGAYLLIKDALEKELKRLRELFNRYKINVQDLSDLGLTVADIVPNADEAGNERFSTERFFIFTTGFDEGTSALYQLHRKGLSDEDKKDPYKGNFFDVLPVPEGTGGRFTALTPVGLLLLAVTANSNKGQTPRSQVEEVMKGAKAALIQMLETDAADLSNTAFAAAAISHIAEYKKGKTIEIFYTYDPIFIDMGWWLNELYSESLQEYGKGINTKPLLGPQDNHMDWNGIIAGPRDKIIRFLMTDEYDESEDLRVPENSGISSKNVSSIEGFKLGRVQNISCRATASSATNPVKKDKQGNKEVLPGVLNFVQILPERTLFNIGQMFYVSQTETAVLGILNGLRSNPDAAGKYTDLTYLQYWVDGYKDNTKDSLFAEKERQIKERKPLDNGGGDTARDEALAMLKEKVYFMHKDVLDESLSGLERFKAVFLDAFYSAPIGAAPSLRDVAGAVKETNAFDQYRIKEGLPITFAFDNSIYIGEEHQNIFRIIYTFNKNFDAISVICAKQENEKFVIGLGGVRYYADENSENLDSLRQELFGETVYLANRTDLRGFLWGNPLDGAFTVVVPHSGTRLGKKSILRLWAKSMVNSGILGKYLILKPDLGTEDSDMSAIEGAVSQIARDLKNIQGKELGIYSLVATSRKLEGGKWSHSKWKVRGISITESLIAAVRMLSRHSEDFPGMKPLTGKDLRVIIDGTGNISNMVNRLLSCALYRNLIKELGMKLKIVGICGEQRGIYNANGINTFGIKGVTLSRRELLSQEAEVLVIAESKRGKLDSSYSDIKVNVVIEGIECALSRELFTELEAQGIVCIPALIASGGSAYASFEEFFHSQVPVKVLNIKEHVLHSIECAAISLTRLVMRRWSLLKKQGLQIELLELTEAIAGEIRAKRDEYLINPDEYVQYRAELDAIRNLSDKAAWLLSSCAVARKEILFDAENEDDLMYKLKNTTGKYGQMDAACFLGEMFSEKAVPVLEMVLSDKNRDYRVRRNAAEALGKIGSAASVETLRWAAEKDKSKKVKDMCVWALERIGVGVEKVKPRRVLEMSGEAVDRLAEVVVRKWSNNAFKDAPLPTLIAITGYSAAGKTYFSRNFIAVIQSKLQEYLKKWHERHPDKCLASPGVLTIDFDDYIMAKPDRPTKLRSLGKMGSLKPEDWLGKWEFSRFYQDVQALRRGQAICKPVFDQITRKRKIDAQGKEDLDTIYPGYNIIIVEGVFSLSHKQTNRHYDLTVFLDGNWELRRNRDIQRYIETGKYYNMDVLAVEKQFVRKHQTEELPAIQEEMAYAEVTLSTDNIPTPPYVAAFYKAVQGYRQWQVNKSNLSFSDKETQLRRLYQHPDFNGIRGSPIEVKVV